MDEVTPLMQKTGERAIRAGWATELADHKGGFAVHWTPRGLECLRQLHLALHDLGYDHIPPEEIAMFRAFANMMAEDGGHTD